VVEGRERSRSFETKALANDFLSSLRAAVRGGQIFDEASGMPKAWIASRESLLDFAVDYVARQVPTWASGSLDSAVEGIARGILLAVPPSAPASPRRTRVYLYSVLKGQARDDIEGAPEIDAWLARWVPALNALDATTVRRIHTGLGLADSGDPLKAATARRFRKDFNQMYAEAVELEKLPKSYWPKPRGKKRRKEQVDQVVDVAALPSPETTARIIRGLVSHQPGSIGYMILSTICWVIGTRPSEARALRIEVLTLPESGPGRVSIEASIDKTMSSGPTKTGEDREVELPEFLVTLLRDYIGDRTEGLLVATRSGRPVGPSNWLRALQRSCDALGVPRVAPYDFRHCCASLLLAEGLPPATIAARLGHSTEVLLRSYTKAIVGHEERVNQVANQLFSGRL
jgi:integrase